MAVGTKILNNPVRLADNELSDDDLERVVGGTTGSNQELDEQVVVGGGMMSLRPRAVTRRNCRRKTNRRRKTR